MLKRITDLAITHANVFELVGNANSLQKTHGFVQINNLHGGAIILMWEPDMELPGHSDLYLMLHADGTWNANLSLPTTPPEGK